MKRNSDLRNTWSSCVMQMLKRQTRMKGAVGQSYLFTLVCRLFVNQGAFDSIFELKQCPRCQVFLKSIQLLSLGDDVISSDKNIVIVWLKHNFISKVFAQHIQCLKRTHI